LPTTVQGFTFNDYCDRCDKVQEHRINIEAGRVFAVCSACSRTSELSDLNQIYYPKTELWVTRFKIDNTTPCAVAGKLLDAIHHLKSS